MTRSPKRGIRFDVSEATAQTLGLPDRARKVAASRYECSPEEARLIIAEIEQRLRNRVNAPANTSGKGLRTLRKVLQAGLEGHATGNLER